MQCLTKKNLIRSSLLITEAAPLLNEILVRKLYVVLKMSFRKNDNANGQHDVF